MVYYFYFLCFGSRRNECNSLFGEKKGEKSEDCGLFWYCLRYAVNDDKMISPATIVYDKYKGDFFDIYIRWGLTPPTDIASGRAHIFRASSSLLISPLVSTKAYCIHSFWSQNTEKRNTTISQMRLRSVFKMRMSILNTATTEQMGYGSISFFVCFL